MREIKFRAWDKKGKRIVDGQSFGPECQPIISFDGYCCLHKLAKEVYEDKIREFILMQFTGLKDKNGKEIYEGDITKWISIGKEGGNQEDVGLKRDMGKSKVFFKDGKFLVHKTIPVGHVNNELEVIGNIHQNKGSFTEDL